MAESVDGVLYFLLTDHLGSTALTTAREGGRYAELRYYPYGDNRYNTGGQITSYRYTGQRWASGTGLYWYRSRWYDPALGRFIQPDTIVPSPSDPQSLNRYSSVLNNPIRYSDPTGHRYEEGYGGSGQYACGTAYGAPCGVPEVEPEAINDIVDEMEEAPLLFQIAVDPAITLLKIYNISLGQGELSRDWDVGLELLGSGGEVAEGLGVVAKKGDTVVYRYVQDGVVKYIGITKDIVRRQGEHLRQRGWVVREITGVGELSRQLARGVEQVLIEHHGLENLENKINSISKNNPIYHGTIKQGRELLEALNIIPGDK